MFLVTNFSIIQNMIINGYLYRGLISVNNNIVGELGSFTNTNS